MKTFKLWRKEDVSGVSGTGYVAEGVIFANGQVALSFYPVAPTYVTAVTVYVSMEAAIKIHGHSGRTEVVYDV